MTQLKKARSERTLREDGVWMYHDTCQQKDVNNNPDYFDEVTTDLIDPEKYASSPLASGVGTRFCLLLGDPQKVYHIADFSVDGLVKEVNEKGVTEYHLLWSRIGNWRSVDIEERSQRRAAGKLEAPEEDDDEEDTKEDVKGTDSKNKAA